MDFKEQKVENGKHKGGEFLRAWRKFNKLTQPEVARMSGIKTTSLSGKERGERPVTATDLSKLARVYGVDVKMLMAAPPSREDAERFARVNFLLEKLSAKQIDAWIASGEALTETD